MCEPLNNFFENKISFREMMDFKNIQYFVVYSQSIVNLDGRINANPSSFPKIDTLKFLYSSKIMVVTLPFCMFTTAGIF